MTFIEDLAGRITLLWGWRRALLAILAGALTVLALPPFDFIAICFFSFPVLVWLLDGALGKVGRSSFRQIFPALFVGWCFGFGYFVAGLWWLGNALLVESDEFAWAIPLAVLALPAVLAVFYGLAAVLARQLWFDGIGRIAALALAFGLAEWLRSFVLTGFPWNAIGYTLMPTPTLMQSASLIGIDAINAVSVFIFAAPALLASRKHRRTGIGLALVLLCAHVGFGYLRPDIMPVKSSEQQLTIRIVQPSIDQSEKLSDTRRDEIFNKHIELSALPSPEGKDKPQLIVWSETAVPFLFSNRPEALSQIGELLEEGQWLVTGAVRSEDGGADGIRFYNSMVLINHLGEIVGAADKVHLVPFGEYLPFASWLQSFGIDTVAATPGGFSAASQRQALQVDGRYIIYPLICYEAIFSNNVQPPSTQPTLMINITNDAWYGRTPGPYQHFRQAQIRAVERGVALVRAANNGISGFADSYGNIVDAFSLDSVGVLDQTINLSQEATFFTRNQWLIKWLIFGAFLCLSLLGGVANRRRSY